MLKKKNHITSLICRRRKRPMVLTFFRVLHVKIVCLTMNESQSIPPRQWKLHYWLLYSAAVAPHPTLIQYTYNIPILHIYILFLEMAEQACSVATTTLTKMLKHIIKTYNKFLVTVEWLFFSLEAQKSDGRKQC